MTTTIVLTDKMQEMKQDIERNLDGMRLTHQAIYNRGLVAYNDFMKMKMGLKINEETLDT